MRGLPVAFVSLKFCGRRAENHVAGENPVKEQLGLRWRAFWVATRCMFTGSTRVHVHGASEGALGCSGT